MGLFHALLNLAGNVAAFVPFGYFLPKLLKSARGFFAVLFTTMFFSLCLEVLQLLTQVGSFDVDDILLNCVGALLGYAVFSRCLRDARRTQEKQDAPGAPGTVG